MEQASPLSNISPLPITTTPPVNPPSSNKSVLIILLVVFVIVLISLNAYLFMKLQNPAQAPVVSPAPVVQASPIPTPDLTANWKTYISNNFKFEIKYPPQFQPNELMSPSLPKKGGVSFNDGDICSKNNITFDIGYDNFPGSITDYNIFYKDTVLGEIMLYVVELPKDDQCLVIKKNDAGEKRLVISIKERNGVKWSFGGTIRIAKEKEDFELLKQILSTFKFLE